MADEDLSIAEALGQDTTATEQDNATVEEPNELETETGDEQETDENDPESDDDGEPELVTVELDGVEYQVPKALEGAFLKNADYTQKTQKLSERNKALDDREHGIEERLKATEEELDARGELRGIEARLTEYAKLSSADWQHHQNTDPFATQAARMEFEDLKARKSQLEGVLEKAKTDRSQAAEQDLATRVEKTLEFAKTIPGWKPEHMKTLVEYAVSEGVDEATLKQNWSPQLLKLLHRAHLGDQMLKKSAKPKPTPPKAPLTTVAAKSNPKSPGLDDRLSTEEWMKRRNAQVAGKGR